jgi:hypothetical protein
MTYRGNDIRCYSPLNIFFLCNHLKPKYVMTFDVIPGFFLHFRIGQRITSTLGRAQKKKAGTTSTNFFDVNISWGPNCRQC